MSKAVRVITGQCVMVMNGPECEEHHNDWKYFCPPCKLAAQIEVVIRSWRDLEREKCADLCARVAAHYAAEGSLTSSDTAKKLGEAILQGTTPCVHAETSDLLTDTYCNTIEWCEGCGAHRMRDDTAGPDDLNDWETPKGLL